MASTNRNQTADKVKYETQLIISEKTEEYSATCSQVRRSCTGNIEFLPTIFGTVGLQSSAGGTTREQAVESTGSAGPGDHNPGLSLRIVRSEQGTDAFLITRGFSLRPVLGDSASEPSVTLTRDGLIVDFNKRQVKRPCEQDSGLFSKRIAVIGSRSSARESYIKQEEPESGYAASELQNLEFQFNEAVKTIRDRKGAKDSESPVNVMKDSETNPFPPSMSKGDENESELSSDALGMINLRGALTSLKFHRELQISYVELVNDYKLVCERNRALEQQLFNAGESESLLNFWMDTAEAPFSPIAGKDDEKDKKLVPKLPYSSYVLKSSPNPLASLRYLTKVQASYFELLEYYKNACERNAALEQHIADAKGSESLLNVANNMEIESFLTSEYDEKVRELGSKIALMSNEIKRLRASRLADHALLVRFSKYATEAQISNIEISGSYVDVCEKNKALEQQLATSEKDYLNHKQKIAENIQTCLVKAKEVLQSTVIKKCEEDLVCSICTELFVEPTALVCSHTFCKYCINKWRREKNDCPTCRSKILSTAPVRALEDFLSKTIKSLTPSQWARRSVIVSERLAAQRVSERPAPPPPLRIVSGRPAPPPPPGIVSERPAPPPSVRMVFRSVEDIYNYLL